MKASINRVMQAMIEYDQGDPMRIHHLLKVHTLAALIGECEGLDEATQEILEVAALIHDIGIHLAVETYGSAAGQYQEIVGPGEAEAMLTELGFSQEVIQRVCFLVGHHHSYDQVDGPDYQILLEADLLVNLYDNTISPSDQRKAYRARFRTETGKRLCRLMYPATEE